MDFMMSCDGMKPPITSGGGGGGLQCPNKTLIEHLGIFSAAGLDQTVGHLISKAAVIRGISSALGIQQEIKHSFNLPRSRLITNVPC